MAKKLHFRQIVIPAHILDDDRLSDGAKITYGKLCRLSLKKGYCWPGNSSLDGTESGHTAARHIKELVDLGYIKVDKKPYRKRKISATELGIVAENETSEGTKNGEALGTKNGKKQDTKNGASYLPEMVPPTHHFWDELGTKNGDRTVLDEQLITEQLHLTENGEGVDEKTENENAQNEGDVLQSGKTIGEDNRHLVISRWSECCKFWNSLGLKPECRFFLNIPARYLADIIRTFRAFSLTDIKNAMENYRNHRKSTSADYVPALTYGGIDTFLISGVPRYFDDAALDDQFKTKTRSEK
jgi:hypothetical protein